VTLFKPDENLPARALDARLTLTGR